MQSIFKNIPAFCTMCVLEYLKMVTVLCGILTFKIKKNPRYVIVETVSLIALMILLIAFCGLNYISLFAMILIPVFVSLEGKNKILNVLIVFMGISCVDEIIQIFVKKFLSEYIYVSRDSALYVIFEDSFSFVIFSVIALLISKKKLERVQSQDSKKFFLVFILLGQTFFSFFIVLNNIREDTVPAIIFSFSLYAIILSTELLLFYNINSKNHYRRTSEINETLLSTKEQYYKLLLNQEQETRKFRHDISNHFLCISTLLKEKKYDDAENYIESLDMAFSSIKIRQKTGNLLINAILYDIMQKYSEVELLWEGLLPEKLNISDVNICTVFSNLLDNAFSAASLNESDKRVGVTVRAVSVNLVVEIKNTFSQPVKQRNGLFSTSKKDEKNHGFGIQNVRKCIESMNGEIEFSYDDTLFSVSIILPDAFKI